jgi:hypothetical protein
MNSETASKRSLERRLHIIDKFAHRLAQRRSKAILITSTNRCGLTNGGVIEESQFLHILFIIILYIQSISNTYVALES